MYQDHGRRTLWDPQHVACSRSFWCAFLGLGLGLGTRRQGLGYLLLKVAGPGTTAGWGWTGWDPLQHVSWSVPGWFQTLEFTSSFTAGILRGSASQSTQKFSPTERCPSYSSFCHLDTLCAWRKYFLSSTIATMKKKSIKKTNKNMEIFKIKNSAHWGTSLVVKSPRSQYRGQRFNPRSGD